MGGILGLDPGVRSSLPEQTDILTMSRGCLVDGLTLRFFYFNLKVIVSRADHDLLRIAGEDGTGQRAGSDAVDEFHGR